MRIEVDSDVQSVLEFMHQNIPASKLSGVADTLPQMARLLWAGIPQEPCVAVSLVLPKTDQGRQSQSGAI